MERGINLSGGEAVVEMNVKGGGEWAVVLLEAPNVEVFSNLEKFTNKLIQRVSWLRIMRNAPESRRLGEECLVGLSSGPIGL